MGVLDRFLDAIRLSDDEDGFLDEELMDEDDLDFYDDEEDMKPKKSFFDRFQKKSSDDLDEFDDEDDFLDEEPEPVKKPARTARTPLVSKVKAEPREERPAKSSKITPMRNRGNSGISALEVNVIKPTSYDDSQEIADNLVAGATVILNLEGIDIDLAQRIIDFASGACYSQNGSLKKISSYIFVLGPSKVEIVGDFQEILGGSVPSVRAGY